jgi:hypothetical protein
MPGSALPPDDDAHDQRDDDRDEFDDAAEGPDAHFDGGGDDDAAEDGDEEGPSGEAVFVTTATPVQIRVAPLDDERVPDGSALAAYLGERMIARCAMPREAVERLMELDLFARPLPLALLAYEEEPGLQCRLFALVPTTALADSDSDDEPWKGSVPSYEDALAASESDDESEDGDENADDNAEETEVAPILLGNIVRFAGDRKHPEDLTAEAVDILQKVITGGPLADANSKAIDDLLGSL